MIKPQHCNQYEMSDRYSVCALIASPLAAGLVPSCPEERDALALTLAIAFTFGLSLSLTHSSTNVKC